MSASQERELFRRIVDGTATAAEFRLLEAQLRTDAALRARYVLSMNLEAALIEELDAAPVVSALTPKRAVAKWKLAAVAAACVLVGFATGFLLRSAAVFQVVDSQSEPRPAFAPYVETDAVARADVAIVTYSIGSEAQRVAPVFQLGQRLRPGMLTLAAGEVQLDFLNGAQVLLQGPATLQIHSLNACTLLTGKAAARVPDSARGFVLNAPDAAVVDLGTEFSVNVNDNGQSDIHVIEGEVEVSLLGNDGNTVKSERLQEDATVRVRRDLATLQSVDGNAQAGLSIPNRPEPRLVFDDAYVQSVKASRPFAYWRFESLDEGRVRNEMDEQFTAVLHAKEGDNSIHVAGGVAHCVTSDSARYFTVEEGLSGWNTKEFSIELWACPQRLQHGAMLDILNADWTADLNTIELALRTSMIHPPGAVRFFHRHPPGQDMRLGVNLFDHETCTPGRWYHIVATKTPTSLSMSINGREVRRIDGPTGSDEAVYQLVIGQMDRSTTARQFEGALDEIALYYRALSADEIAGHFRLVKPD